MGQVFAKQQHFISNHVFEVDGDRASGRANLIFAGVMDATNSKMNYRMGMRYTWQFTRTDDGWKTVHTKVEKVWEA